MTVTALIPAFNEASTIGAVVGGVLPLVSDVVVVDDGSTDMTGRAAAEAGARVLTQPSNLGKGLAVRRGLDDVLARPTVTHVLLLDGDMQHRPADVPALLAEAARTGADLVVGERRFDRSAMPRSRYYSNTIGSAILSRFIGTDVGDTQSGFRLVRAAALRGVPLTARGYEIETEMLIKLARRGASIARVTVESTYEGVKSSIRPVRDTTRTCFLAVHYRFFATP
ncbi:MAG: glycosyltransferase family 2 protein [Vicinamibacterales bacterium]